MTTRNDKTILCSLFSVLVLTIGCEPVADNDDSANDDDVADDDSSTLDDDDSTTTDDDSTSPADDDDSATSDDDSVPLDEDGDGWSDDADCDDSDPAVNPEGVEVYEDGIDQDCSGFDVGYLQTGDLVISEIMSRGYSPDYNWFEIYVIADHDVDLSDSSLADEDGDRFYPPDGLVLESGSHHVFEGSDIATPFNGTTWDNFFHLAVDKDEVIIFNYAGFNVAKVEYDCCDWPLAYSQSMNLDPDHLNEVDNNYPTYWCYATSVYSGYSSTDGGTPGSENDECN